MHALMYCPDAANVSMERSSSVVPDVLAASNDSWLSNTTDLQQQSTTDNHSAAERRATQVVYLVIRYYIYQGIIPAIMIAGVVGNLASLLLGVRCRSQMSSLENVQQSLVDWTQRSGRW